MKSNNDILNYYEMLIVIVFCFIYFLSTNHFQCSEHSAKNMFSFFSGDQKETEVDDSKDKQIMCVAVDIKDNFPSEIRKPSEQTRYETLTEHETTISQHLSKQYQSQISKFAFWTEDIIPRFVTDTYYIDNLDKRLELTTSRFEQYLQHRTDFHFDDILTRPSLNTDKHWDIVREDRELLALYFYGIDHEGHPIMWDDGSAFGKAERIKQTFGNDDYKRASYFRCRMQRMQRNLMLKLSRHFSCKISKICLVMDFAKFTVTDFYNNRAFTQWNLRSSSELFPETMHKLIIVNAPWAFQMIWKICKNFLDAITVEKTIILGGNYMDELLKYMDVEMIPKEFGGKGIWTARVGDVPVDFAFQMDDIQTESKDKHNDEVKDSEETDDK
eukprot:11863_1